MATASRTLTKRKYPDVPPVARNLEKLRMMRGWSAAETARKLGVEPMTYYRWRDGYTIPPWEQVLVASRLFQIPAYKLYDPRSIHP